MTAGFFLPDDYRSREHPNYFEDAGDAADVWQPDVYSLVAALAQRLDATGVVDIGCGQAAKLLRLAGTVPLTGVDYGENIAACRAAHPEHRWLEADLERDLAWVEAVPEGAIVVSSDVIEHLVDPKTLLDGLAQVRSRARAIVISTPERIRTHGPDHQGPPTNAAHVREWALPEFETLLAGAGLSPLAIGATRSCNTRPELATIVAVIEGGARRAVSASPGWQPWHGQDGRYLISPVYDTVDEHLAAAAASGATTVEVTDLRLLDVVAGRAPATEVALLRQPPLVAVASTDHGPSRVMVAACNLVAVPLEVTATEARARCDQNLPVALTGCDASSDWWPLSTVTGLRRRMAESAEELERALRSIAELKAWVDEQEHAKLALMEELRTVSRTISWHAQQADYWRAVAVGGEAEPAGNSSSS